MGDRDKVRAEVNRAKELNGSHHEDYIPKFGYRHQQSLILFFTLTIAYSMRACMGLALVAMTSHPEITSLKANGTDNSTDDYHYEANGFLNAMMFTPPYPTFDWSKKVQDTIIASFFWGYVVLQIPSGYLALRFGSKRLLTAAMMTNCVVSLVYPLAAYYGGWVCAVIFRIIQGLSQSCIFPGMHTFFGKWAPLQERGRLTAITYGGQALGTVLGLPITGFVSSTFMGWPGVFRVYGVLSGIIGVVLWLCAFDTPAKHPTISAPERKYIEQGVGIKEGEEQKKKVIPWARILRSPGLYAIVVAHCGQTWGQLILYSEVPAFMDKVMGLDIKANGMLTALPFLVMWFTNFFFSWFTDMLIVKKLLSVTHTRKLANSIGGVPTALGLVALAYVPKNVYVVESLLVIICSLKISAHVGFQINHIDMSPNFAGTLMSISNLVSNGVSSLAPILTGFILTDVHDEYLWRKVFLVAAGMYFFTNLFYVVFGTAEKAAWDDPDSSTSPDDGEAGEATVMLKDDDTVDAFRKDTV